MTKVMKIITWTLRVFIGLLVIFVAFNQFDAGKFTAVFQAQDFPPVSFNVENGYYRLMALGEAQETDIMAEPTVIKYRRLFDPQYDNKKYIEEWDHSAYRNMFGKELEFIRSKIRKTSTGRSNWIDGFINLEADWSETVLASEENILAVKSRWQGYLDRYQKMLECKQFEDFSLPQPQYITPNLLAWLQVGRVYIVVNMLDAMQGNWDQGVRNLLAHVDFCKRSVAGSRLLINNLIAKAMTRNTLYGLVSLMNRQECPKEIYQTILNGLPPIRYEEYGGRKSLMFEYLLGRPTKESINLIYKDLNGFNRMVLRLLFQENRSQKYFYDIMATVARYDQTPPSQWNPGLEKLQPQEPSDKGWFWWLQNPTGKNMLYKSSMWTNSTGMFHSIVPKSHQLKILYDLTRVSAELHLKYDPEKPVMETLLTLDTYKTPDPGSENGKPYSWNEQKHLLYGLGIDRKDDNGKMDYGNPLDSDFAIPVILYVK
ncbi:MAG: hypothetical protein NT166_15770 [Candidatus Aminicenantes bacterium]|nr:hypothetical protein [Candidatus Aminicenantes bacterium]